MGEELKLRHHGPQTANNCSEGNTAQRERRGTSSHRGTLNNCSEGNTAQRERRGTSSHTGTLNNCSEGNTAQRERRGTSSHRGTLIKLRISAAWMLLGYYIHPSYIRLNSQPCYVLTQCRPQSILSGFRAVLDKPSFAIRDSPCKWRVYQRCCYTEGV